MVAGLPRGHGDPSPTRGLGAPARGVRVKLAGSHHGTSESERMAPTPTNRTETARPGAVASKTTMTLAEAARRCRTRGGRGVDPATVARWIFRGIRLASGDRLRLGAVRRSGRLETSPELLDRFFAAQATVAACNGTED